MRPRPRGPFARRLRFGLLERALLPAAAPLFGALLSTWKLGMDAETPVRPEELAARPRLVVGTCHGMLLHMLLMARLAPLRGRPAVVLLSPSRDGRLLAAFLARFGIGHAVGTTGSGGVGGAHAFARRVAAGEIGVVAVDGPSGPCARMTAGWLRVSAAVDAAPYLFLTAASRGWTFGSWDRAHLPAPFARVHGWCAGLPSSDRQSPEDLAAVAQARLVDGARRLASPVLADALRAVEEAGASPAAGC